MRERTDLKKPTIADRRRCNNLLQIKDGTVLNLFDVLAEWAMAGLECTEEELFNNYSDNDIQEIGIAVKELANVNPQNG